MTDGGFELRAAGSLDLAQSGGTESPLVAETHAVGGSDNIKRFVESFNGEVAVSTRLPARSRIGQASATRSLAKTSGFRMA
jgi:hypothetical protein